MPWTSETGTASRDWWEHEEAAAITRTILLVEDETFVRGVACEILESAGYRVLAARDADEAKCLYDAHCGEVDLLLTDVVLPGRSGPELAAALRQKSPALKILFTTGYPEQLQSRLAAQNACMAKPFSSSTLLETIKKLLPDHASESRVDRPPMPFCGVELPAVCEQEYLIAAVCG